MLAIRFQRVGRTKQPFYRVVVSEKTKDMYGKHLEILGTYNPRSKETALKAERIKHWLSKGAQASAVVFNLLIKEGLIEGQKKKKAVAISKRRQAKKEADNKKEEETKEVKTETSPETAPASSSEEKPSEEKAEDKKE